MKASDASASPALLKTLSGLEIPNPAVDGARKLNSPQMPIGVYTV